MSNYENLIQDAIMQQQAGNLAVASKFYHKILEKMPEHIEATFLLGNLNLQQGNLDEAIVLLKKTLELNPDHIKACNVIAGIFQRQGQFDDAVGNYKHSLKFKPDFAETHFNLGTVFHMQGKLDEAAENYNQAIALNKNYTEAYYNLGNALKEQGKFKEAIETYGQAILLNPNDFEAHSNLGNVFRESGNHDEAITSYRKALELKPEGANIICNLGAVLHEQGKPDEAIAYYKRAIALKPEYAEAYCNLGITFKEKGEFDNALSNYNRAITIKPEFAPAHYNLGNLLHEQGKLDEAVVSFNRAISIKQNYSEAYCNLGLTLQEQGNLDDAIANYKLAISISADNADAYNKLGVALQKQGKLGNAEECYDRAIGLRNDFADAHFNKSLVLLLTERFKEGWQEYEWRLRTKVYCLRDFQQPMWDGRQLNGKTVLVHAEQGFGDVLQFIRYLPMVKARGGHVIFECPHLLVRLLRNCAGYDQIIELDPQSLPNVHFDFHVPLLSLPGIFGTDTGSIPENGPYISVDSDLISQWSLHIKNKNAFKIGIVWAGAPRHTNNRYRSCSLSDFAPLAQLPGIDLYSLQKGEASKEILNPPEGMNIVDLGDKLNDFAETSAVICNLDLIISVDTAVVHLAGAINKPVWNILPLAPDWRWLLGRDNSPWYPSMRFFRQTRPNEWENVFEQIKQALLQENAGSMPQKNIDEIFNLSTLNLQQGQLDTAGMLLKKVILLNPEHVIAYHNLGAVLQAQGKLTEAMASYEHAIKLKPDYADAHYNIGNLYRILGYLDKAISSYRKSLQFNPEYTTYVNMGNTFKDLGDLDEAISCYQESLKLKPDCATYVNMGNAFKYKSNLNEAISCYQNALDLNPNHADAYYNMGNAFKEESKISDAISCYQKALQIKYSAGTEVKKTLMLPVICESNESIKHYRNTICDQIELIKNKGIKLEDPNKQVGSTNFYLVYHGLNDKEIQMKIASFYLHVCPDLAWTPAKDNIKQRKHNKIEIGIISNFLHKHTIGRLNYGIIKNISKEKFYIKLFRFQGRKGDTLSKAIDSVADEVIVLPDELKMAREKIAGHMLDILFYTDIGMAPLTYFLAFSRLAPVQCVTWGHPVTTGIPNMDYFISLENAEPNDADEHYSERLVRLKRFSTYYYRPELPEEVPTREKFDLPDGPNLYLCPQSLFKFHPEFDNVLGDILRRDTRGLLVLIEGKHKNWSKLLRERFCRVVPDVIDRIRFLPSMPPDDFLSLLIVADVVLDTPYFGGGNTNLEAFACGVPVVTWPGLFLRSRLTLALYKQMEVMECVAHDAQSYVDIAYKLGNDMIWRDEVKNKIKVHAGALFEDIEAVRELERFFEYAVNEKKDHEENI